MQQVLEDRIAKFPRSVEGSVQATLCDSITVGPQDQGTATALEADASSLRGSGLFLSGE